MDKKVDLGTAPIGKLLFRLAVPTVVAQLINMLYNIVDRIYIGHIPEVGSLALTGVGVCMPLIMIVSAFAALAGSGGAPRASIYMGKGQNENAEKTMAGCLSMLCIVAAVLTAVLLIWSEDLLLAFGASENTLPYAKEYISIILIGNVITHLYFGLNAAMRSSGNPKKAMGLTIFTVVFNTILDPVFIFVFDMGIAGAAWATVIAQTIAMLIVMHHFNDKKRPFHFEKGIFKLDMRVAKDSLSIGMGPFLMNAAACLVTLFINQQLREYSGDLGIGAYGICNRFIFMFIMICMGLNQGMQPIAGYNYGARQYSRVREVFWKTAKLGMLMTTVCFIFGMFLPKTAVGIFTHDEQLLELSARALRITTIVFPIVGFQMIATNFFQSLGMVRKSIILSLSRQILFLLPMLYLLPTMFGSDGVWASFPIADSISTIMTVFMLGRLFKKFGTLKDGDDPSILGSNL